MTVIGVKPVKDKWLPAAATEASNSNSKSKGMCLVLSIYKKAIQNARMASLGSLQVVVGVVHTGLGGKVTCLIGILFIIVGMVSILAEQYPHTGYMFITLALNIFGAIFDIFAIVIYSVDTAHQDGYVTCLWRNEPSYDPWYNRHRSNPYDEYRDCMAPYIQALVRSINVTLIILAVLQLCLHVRVAVLGFKFGKDEEKEPSLKDVSMSSPDV